MDTRPDQILRLNRVSIALWLLPDDPARPNRALDFARVTIILPSESSYETFTVVRPPYDRVGVFWSHSRGLEQAWWDESMTFPSRLLSGPTIQKINAFKQRMWHNRSCNVDVRLYCVGWLLGVLRQELHHDFFDQGRLRVVLSQVLGLMSAPGNDLLWRY